MVIATMFDEDKNNYVDEVIGFDAGEGTDPKLYDIYFGKTNPPPLRLSNFSQTNFWNGSLLEFNTTYYWKVDTWDANGTVVYGEIWNFTTRGNDPPDEPYNPIPWNGSTNMPIKINLSWKCEDPDSDDVLFDVYFGDHPTNISLKSSNQSELYWNPLPLGFQRTYFWQIIAWDEYDYKTVGPIWHFTTEPNYPPDKASNPFPKNGENAVPVDIVVKWNGTDPNIGDTLKYDVYFDDVFPPI